MRSPCERTVRAKPPHNASQRHAGRQSMLMRVCFFLQRISLKQPTLSVYLPACMCCMC